MNCINFKWKLIICNILILYILKPEHLKGGPIDFSGLDKLLGPPGCCIFLPAVGLYFIVYSPEYGGMLLGSSTSEFKRFRRGLLLDRHERDTLFEEYLFTYDKNNGPLYAESWAPFQLSLVHEKGQLFDKKRSIYGFRVNLISGFNYEVFGIDLGLYNKSCLTYGIQMAGLFNVSGTEMNGIQVAGLINAASNLNGLQISLYNNTANGMRGGQFTVWMNYLRMSDPVMNSNDGGTAGLQLAGVGNIFRYDTKTIGETNANLMQISLLFNYASQFYILKDIVMSTG